MRVQGKRRAGRLSGAFAFLCAVVSLVACAPRDLRTVIVVWSWEPSMHAVARSFEKANPDVRVDIRDTAGYDNLNASIQDGYGMPDVAQLEYHALPQYAVSGQLLDLTDRVAGDAADYTTGTWSSVRMNGRIYGVPMDSGPMAFFYNQSVFEQVGIDASRIRTWDDYYAAAKRLKAIGVSITADAGDADFYDAMIWMSAGRPFSTSDDGRTVTVNLTHDEGTRKFSAFWQRMIDEGLVDTSLESWSEPWIRALGDGTVASVFSGAWMPSLLLADVPGTAGLWRVSEMPTADGVPASAEIGGSSLAILQSSRKPQAAFRFVQYACHDAEGIGLRVDGGAFPADTASLNAPDFLQRTTIRDSRGIDVPYFGGQRFNAVFSAAAKTVSQGYRYLPFEVYARNDFRATVGKAYAWRDGDADGNDGTPRVTLMQGMDLWQRDLEEYGRNQGFVVG